MSCSVLSAGTPVLCNFPQPMSMLSVEPLTDSVTEVRLHSLSYLSQLGE